MKTNLQRVLIIGIPIIVIGIGFGAYNLTESYRQTQQLIASQQQSLTTAQQEIKSLAANASSSEAATRNEIAQAQTTVQKTTTPSSDTASIQASEIAPYENGVMQLSCGYVSGSASLWNIPSFGYVALTNFHVIKDRFTANDSNGACALIPDSNVNTGPYLQILVIPSQYQTFNNTADEAILPIGSVNVYTTSGQIVSEPANILDYKISSLPKCDAKMPLDAPVVVLGFPAYAMQEVPSGIPSGFPGGGGNALQSSLIASNGVISGYDPSSIKSSSNPTGLPYVNYYVSAKIDSGNSGGIAFSKNTNGLCVLGIPTWINTGNYANEGIVQNINNVMYGSLP